MEQNRKLGAVVIITASALFTFFNPVKSECVPLIKSYVARSLLPVFPPSNTEYSPSPTPEIPVSIAAAPTIPPSPTNPPANPPSQSELEGSSPTNPPANPPSQSELEAPSPTNPPANPPSQSELEAPSPTETEPLISPGNIMNLSQPLLNPEFKNICGQTDFPPLCESSVKPLITDVIKPDKESVLLLMIQASIDATKATQIKVGQLANAADCQELYDSAVSNLEDAVNAVKSRDPFTVNSNLSAAMTDYVTCNDGFEEAGEPNPIADVADKLMKMASNCLAISVLG